jgi:hypothetical protein
MLVTLLMCCFPAGSPTGSMHDTLQWAGIPETPWLEPIQEAFRTPHMITIVASMIHSVANLIFYIYTHPHTHTQNCDFISFCSQLRCLMAAYQWLLQSTNICFLRFILTLTGWLMSCGHNYRWFPRSYHEKINLYMCPVLNRYIVITLKLGLRGMDH